ncbi:MAG: Na/Pi cotransporter family protein [Pseudomonadota bacterium]
MNFKLFTQFSYQHVGFQFLRMMLGIGFLTLTFVVFAAEANSEPGTPDWLQIGLGMFGGLALFLAGLQLLSEGMKKAAGQAMTLILAKLTTNRFMGALTGAFVTGILNSSTVTTLLVVGFISGGMMTLTQSVGVIMGANIGSTVTAQLLAFDLAAYSLAPVAIGFFMLFSAKRDKIKYYGMMIMGIGLVFYGMGLMADSMTPLRSYEPFLNILENMERPLAGIIAGALFTAIVQSSAATVGIAIAMASEGLLSLPAGIALALGANIGTAVTTAMMGILSSKSTEATRASIVHVVFNIFGVLIWLPIIWLLVDVAIWISPSSPELDGIAKASAEVPRQIANANTFFNIINTILFIGFTGWFAKLAEWLVPEKKPQEGIIIEPKFLDKTALASTPMALQQVRLELARVGYITVNMLKEIQQAFKDRDMECIKDINRYNDEIAILEAEILRYLALVRKGLLTEQESLEFQGLMTATDNFQNLAGIIQTDLVFLAQRAANSNLQVSEETTKLLMDVYLSVLESVELTVQAIRDNDQSAAESVLMYKDTIYNQAQILLSRKAERLTGDDEDYLDLVRIQMSMLDNMRHIYSLTRRIAKVFLPEVLAQRD